MSLGDPVTGVTSYGGSLLWTLEEIGRLISGGGDASETLTNIVHLIRRRFGTDVCSVHLMVETLVEAGTMLSDPLIAHSAHIQIRRTRSRPCPNEDD